MNSVDTERVLRVIQEFVSYNQGDDSTVDLIMNIGSEILDVSVDRLLEMLPDGDFSATF